MCVWCVVYYSGGLVFFGRYFCVVGRAEFGRILWILSPLFLEIYCGSFYSDFVGIFWGLVEISITAYSYEF